jgi:2-succinyl-5-enolpyruvyl-6-hydroxy-3-cyclohexene-1-carboxylate synthase
MSVPSVSEVQATFCATLVDEFVRAGVRDVVLCPGSRSTPLVLAFGARSDITCHVRIDERSAGFFALGRALDQRTPVAIVVTSGTAAAELHAAVAEADLANVPLLVLTADRPPELRGVGAPQTIGQTSLYGPMVRLFAEPGVPRLDAQSTWRSLASRAWRAASGREGAAGPVHLNLSFIEPLVAEPLELPAGRADGGPWTFAPVAPQMRSAVDITNAKVLAVVGAGVSAAMVRELWSLSWVVIGDATVPHTMPYADPLLRSDAVAEALRPDVVVRLGGAPASKFLAQRLKEWAPRVVGFTGAGLLSDPDGLIMDRLPGLPDGRAPHLLGNPEFVTSWASASRRVGDELAALDGGPLSEITLARQVVELATAHEAPLVIGSSMPVRDVEWWAPSRVTPTYANRGANGIDGVVSTILGVATGQQAIGFVGDITFLHDVSALVDGTHTDTSAVIVVADNNGGGIFDFLPQASLLSRDDFEAFFATPRPHDLVVVARAFGHEAARVHTVEALREAVTAGLARPGVTVVVAEVPARGDNVALHAALNDAVREWST